MEHEVGPPPPLIFIVVRRGHVKDVLEHAPWIYLLLDIDNDKSHAYEYP
jgi:hypothetical protein